MDIQLCTPARSNNAPIPTEAIVERIIAIAEYLTNKRYYPYQKETAVSFCTSIIERDGEHLTALYARQSGKTEVISGCISALALILPVLANMELFKDDWRFNLTDEQGNYRGFRDGVSIGIYAPRQEQSDLMFSRICNQLGSPRGRGLLEELHIEFDTFKGELIRLSSGTVICARTASEQSKIEGATYHVLVLEEAQDIGTLKIRKSLHPMTSSLRGTVMKIGTCSITKSEFYHSIRTNIRREASTGKKLHFYNPYTICQNYNSLYKDYVRGEKERIGEDSDEFRMAYGCEWILERGMFIDTDKLLNERTMDVVGRWSEFWHLPAIIVNGRKAAHLAHPTSTQVAGIDFGKIHDPTVICVIDVDWMNPVVDQYVETMETTIHFRAYRKHIVGFKEIQGDNYEEQFTQITTYLAQFKGLRKITLDETGVGQWGKDKFITYYDNFLAGYDQKKQQIIHHIEIDGFNFAPTNQSEGFKLLQSDLLAARLTIPCGDRTRKTREFNKFIAQMLDLRKDYQNGHMMCSAPDEPEAHDDYADSVMLANWGANTPADTGNVDVLNENVFFQRR